MPPRRRNDDDDEDQPSFEDWMRNARPTDPDTSREAAQDIDYSAGQLEAFGVAKQLPGEDFTRDEFYHYCVEELGMGHPKAEGLRRRLTELIEKGLLEVVEGVRRKARQGREQEVLRIKRVAWFPTLS